MNILKQIKNLAGDTTVKSSGPLEDWYITAERAEGIKDTDRFSKSDPYLKIEFGGKHVKTRTINNDRSPAWNETFHFQLSSGNAKDIRLVLMDNDVGLDDTIGTATISKADLPLMSGEEKCLKVPIYRKEVISGLIHLRVKKVSANSSISTNTSSTYSQNQMSSSNYPNTYQQQQQQPSNFGSSNQYQPYNTSSNMPPPTYNQSYNQQPYNQQPYNQQSFNAPPQSFNAPPQSFNAPYNPQQGSYNPQQGSYNPQQGPYQSQTGPMQPQQQPSMNMPQTNYPQSNNNYGDQYQQRRY